MSGLHDRTLCYLGILLTVILLNCFLTSNLIYPHLCHQLNRFPTFSCHPLHDF